MPGRKAGKGKAVSGSTKAGLQFPVGRMQRYIKRGMYAQRVGGSAGVYLASAIESVIQDILEVAAGQADM